MTETVLPREYLAASGTPRHELVLLHGWGCNREVWRPLVAAVRSWANITLIDLPGCGEQREHQPGLSLEQLLAAVLAAAPPRACYVGWSLGGQLASLLASSQPQRVAALLTVASNPRFVADGDWPGVAPEVLAQFSGALHADPANTLRRFDALQVHGAARSGELRRQLAQLRGSVEREPLQIGLDWLRELDLRPTLASLGQPQCHLLGTADALVPAALGPALEYLLQPGNQVRVQLLEGLSHVLPLEAPDAIASALEILLAGTTTMPAEPEPVTLPGASKQSIAASFSRAAHQYDSVAALQRDVGGRLLEQLAALPQAPEAVLDLGCGTGYFYPALRRQFPGARYIGLDLAPGMLDYARSQHPDADSWLCADAEQLPLASASVDLIYSSLAIQWCYQPQLLFAELARVLRPGGRCVFSSLGPATLHELRSAWAAVDSHRHVNEFLPAAALQSAVAPLPGVGLQLHGERFRMNYPRVGDLLHELKTLGAHNMNPGRASGLAGRKPLQAMIRAYENFRECELLPATYDVLFGVMEKA